MISYRLVCPTGHEFDGWFSSSAAYDAQLVDGAVSCPLCGDTRIAKGIMAPAVKTSVTKRKGRPEPLPPKVAPEQQKVGQFMAGFRKYVMENSEYVGREFPEEARKIHYGETEERQIYGEATPDEAQEMVEEGLDIAPLPPDPDDLN